MSDSSIASRVKQIIDYEGINIMSFEKKINVGNNTIGIGIRRNSSFNGSVLNKILNTYPNINPGWLITGKGTMLLEPEKEGGGDIPTHKKVPPLEQETPVQSPPNPVEQVLIEQIREKDKQLEAKDKQIAFLQNQITQKDKRLDSGVGMQL